MNYSDKLAEISEKIAKNIGLPCENAVCIMRRQGNGAQLITTRNGRTVAVNASVPFGGYIRHEGNVMVKRAQGCATHEYQTLCYAVVHKRDGDSLELADMVAAAIINSNTRERIEVMDIDRIYEEIMDEELANVQVIPTQGNLALVRVRFTITFTLLDCELMPKICAAIPPPPPIPPTDLQMFFDNTGITDPAIIAPITVFYNTAAGRSYRPKTPIFYPFVGGNADAHKYNLFNPYDTDAANRLTFFGGGLHTANGYAPNGLNAYANTYYTEIGNAVVGRGNLGYYSRTNTGSVQTCDIGSNDGANSTNIFPRVTIVMPDRLYLRHGSAGAQFVGGQTQTIRLYQCNRVSPTEIRARINGAFVVAMEPFIAQCTRVHYIAALNNVGTAQFYSARQLGCAFIANDGFTDAELIDFETDVNALMTALGRAV